MIFLEKIAEALGKVMNKPEDEILPLLKPPKEKSYGDIAFPCFMLAKELKKSPAHLAQSIAKEITIPFGKAEALGPYVNITIENNAFIKEILTRSQKQERLLEQEQNNQEDHCSLIESPSPNTNKPLHLGHLRNMLLGSTLARLKKQTTKNVHIVNLVNDRGIHICKSMLAYKEWGNGKTPESEGKKGDHFVGEWYVKFNQEVKQHPELENKAQDLLVKWEQGDQETIELWKKMNSWALKGFEQTYNKINFHIDNNYYESEVYTKGKEIILQGAKENIFTQDESGAIVADLTDKKLDKKILLRKDGTAVYITQDIFLAKKRFEDYQFNEMIYIVGNEQEYHFEVLFEIFKKLKYPFAKQCKHFSYGMVELPEGKMKSREGTVVDIDDLLEETISLAKDAVNKRYDNLSEEEINTRAHMIAHGAIRFFFLKFDPVKNFVFNPKASLSFEGETGPYVQYTHARNASILRKSTTQPSTKNFATLQEDEEKELAKLLGLAKDIVQEATEKLKPNNICNYLLLLCQTCNNYYGKHKIIQENKDLEADRLALIKQVNKVINEGLELLGITAPERM